jgi:cytochrome b
MDTLSFHREKSYDAFLRLLHWTLVVCILFLFATELAAESVPKGEMRDMVWHGHVLTGYALACTLGLRLIWGFIGGRHARWPDFWHPAQWRALLVKRERPDTAAFGHDPLASLAYLGLYAILAGMVTTGFIAAAGYFDLGPLSGLGISKDLAHDFKEVHEVAANLILLFVLAHIGALIFHERRGPPMAQAMVSGWQYRPGKRDE